MSAIFLLLIIVTTMSSQSECFFLTKQQLKDWGFTNKSVNLNYLYTSVSRVDEDAFEEFINLQIINLGYNIIRTLGNNFSDDLFH